MDDIDSYYTERPAYPRPPPPGNRSYPPPQGMRMGPPPFGRPPMGPNGRPMGPPRMGPPRSQSPGPRMGPGPMGGPMGRPMGPPGMGGQRPMGRPMGPAMGQRMGPPGPPPMGALPRRPESPFREPPPMGALARRPESPFREPAPMGALARRPESPLGAPAGPPPMSALPKRPESPEFTDSPTTNMIPAPLNLRRPSPPPEPIDAPQRRPTPPMTPGRMRPLDSIGAPRMRSPSPNPNAMVRPLNSIGAPRPPRSSSARPAEDRIAGPDLLAPQWDGHSRSRSASADDYRRPDDLLPAALAPARFEILSAATYSPVSPKDMAPDILPTTVYRTTSPQPIAQAPPMIQPGTVSPRQPNEDDVLFGLEDFEDITVGPYQDIDVPPPLPRKNSIKPSVASQVLAPQRLPSPNNYARQPLPATPEDESPLPSNRGLKSMWLGDIQAGPYADAPAMPAVPSRSQSRSPPLDTPDMSEPPSDSEDNFGGHSLPPLFAGLRIHTGSEAPTLSAMTYNPHESSSTSDNYTPETPDDHSRDSYATDIVDAEIKVDESSPTEFDDELPGRNPRKHIPSMHEYMSMDQLEDMWGKQDEFGSGYFGFEAMPVSSDEHVPAGTPF